MSTTQYAQYLESKVLTAQPQRLHLMLLEGALRFGRQAEELIRTNQIDAAMAPMLRLLDIVGELLVAVRERKTELNGKIAEFYWFLFRQVSLAKIHGDPTKLAEALRLMEYERETWQLVCDRLECQVGKESTRDGRFPQHVRRAQPELRLEA